MRKNESKVPHFGRSLKEERAQLGLTQIELAQKLNISLRAIRSIEQGKQDVSLKTANRIFNFFGKELYPQAIAYQGSYQGGDDLTTEEVIETLRSVLPIFKSRYNIKKLALFGSFSTGHQTKKSDIDILIEIPKNYSAKDEGEMLVILESLFHMREIDIAHKHLLYEDFKEKILDEAIWIKERKRTS